MCEFWVRGVKMGGGAVCYARSKDIKRGDLESFVGYLARAKLSRKRGSRKEGNGNLSQIYAKGDSVLRMKEHEACGC